MVDALDQSWSRIDPKAAYASGIRLITGYLSHDTNGKNITAAWVKAYHEAGIGVLFNWESDPGRPLLGASAGVADATNAVAQLKAIIKAVGYEPATKLSLYYSCDRDVNAGQYGAIDTYYSKTKTVSAAGGFLNGVYGEYDLVNHLHAEHLTDTEWQTLAWSGGRISTEADLYQQSINNKLDGVAVDFDTIEHIATLGAWWPPGKEPVSTVLDWTQMTSPPAWFNAAVENAVATQLARYGIGADGKQHQFRTLVGEELDARLVGLDGKSHVFHTIAVDAVREVLGSLAPKPAGK